MSTLPSPFLWVSQLNKQGNEHLLLLSLAKKSDEFGRVSITLHNLVKESGLSFLKVIRALRRLNKDKIIYAQPSRSFYYLRMNMPPELFTSKSKEA